MLAFFDISDNTVILIDRETKQRHVYIMILQDGNHNRNHAVRDAADGHNNIRKHKAFKIRFRKKDFATRE